MERFKLRRFDRIGNSIGFKGSEVATLYTPSKGVNDVICCAPISAEAVDLIKAALVKFKRIEMSHADFIDEVDSILLEYTELLLES